MAVYAEHAQRPASGAFVQSIIEMTHVLTDTGQASASSKLEALREWMAHATPEEIAQEIQGLLSLRKE